MWTLNHRKVLPDLVVKYTRKKLDETVENLFGYFYLLYKLHNTPVITWPICSDCASLPHALGQWVDEILQPIVKGQGTYIQDFLSFKAEINKIFLPPNASIFIYDAKSMYTNIDRKECIASISEFLKRPSTCMKFQHYYSATLIEALIIMKNNCMRFGDLPVKQLMGIAMGVTPPPTISNLNSFVSCNISRCFSCCFDDTLTMALEFDSITLILLSTTNDQNWKTFKVAVNSGGLAHGSSLLVARKLSSLTYLWRLSMVD